jgi:hypothetical protein
LAHVVSLYIVGYTKSLLDCLQEYEYVPGWSGLVDQDLMFPGVRIRSATLVLILVLGIVGTECVTRVQKLLLLLLIYSQLDFVISSFLHRTTDISDMGFSKLP